MAAGLVRQPDIAGWSSSVARRAHNPKVVGSNPAPATKILRRDHTTSKSSVISSLYLNIRYKTRSKSGFGETAPAP